jgi:LmbE family N-acetylglucosaminyl deacetylase
MLPNERVAVVVAHPDDETLWAGGTILSHREWTWTIVTICRRSDPDRAAKFLLVLDRLGADGAMADLDDGPDQHPIDVRVVEETVLSLLPRTEYDILVTHSPFGEYTRHRRHEETARAVAQLWSQGRLRTRRLWMFAYEDGDKQYLPRAIERAHLVTRLDGRLWEEKAAIIQHAYGFERDSWESQTTPRVEAFWCFDNAGQYRAWLADEQKRIRGVTE